MTTKLYVGNLSYQTTEDQLRQIFGDAGPIVSVSVVTDRATNQPRGFAFVEMQSAEDAQKAIGMINGRMVDSRPLVVNESKPRQDSFGGRGR